jgi:hypothetical protein
MLFVLLAAVALCVISHFEAAQPGAHSAWQLLVCGILTL